MTITNQSNQITYQGNGFSTAFAFPFLIPNTDGLVVTLTDLSGNQTIVAPNLFNVIGIGSATGGQVTYPLSGSPLPNTFFITIARQLPIVQDTSLSNQGNFFPRVVEGALDYLTMLLQQVSGSVGRYLQYPAADVGPVTVLPIASARAGKFFGWDGNGNPAMVSGNTIPVDLSAFSTKATGSVTSRTLAARAADWYNVKDYGATGSGADESVAIQACFDAVALNGGYDATVFFPGGRYSFGNIAVGVNGASSQRITIDATGALIFLPVAAPGDGSPIFYQRSGYVIFKGGLYNGNQVFQPADGFSDSFNSGAGGKGRAYRCAIRSDHAAFSQILSLTVENVRFTAMYGACVATNDVPKVRVQNCTAESTKFEIAYCYYTAVQGEFCNILDNLMDTLASGDATVNANGIAVFNYKRAIIKGNTGYNIERSIVAVTGGNNVSILSNQMDTNTKDNYAGIAIDGTAIALTRVLIGHNILFNVGCGIKFTGTNVAMALINANKIYTTTGTTLGDGLFFDKILVAHIVANVFHDIKRHGMLMNGATASMRLLSNYFYGKGTVGQYGMQLNANLGTWTFIDINNNTWFNFEQSNAGSGVINFLRSGGFTLGVFNFKGNTISAASNINRALRDNGVDLFTFSFISDNYIDGVISLSTPGPRGQYRNNNSTGAFNVPGGSVNILTTGQNQNTVGAAGGATALPATPLGYEVKMIGNGVVAVPYYNP